MNEKTYLENAFGDIIKKSWNSSDEKLLNYEIIKSFKNIPKRTNFCSQIILPLFYQIEKTINSPIWKPNDFEPDIFKACKEAKLLSVRYLIEHQNVDIDIKDEYRRTPLHWACEKGHLPIVEYLISKGANVNERDRLGNFVIHSACLNGGHLPIVEYLCSKGADIEAKDAFYKRTPLHWASYWGKTEIVKFLVSKGANKNVVDSSGKTPYELANQNEIKNILNDNKVDINK